MKRLSFYIITVVLFFSVMATNNNADFGDIRSFCSTCNQWSDEADHYSGTITNYECPEGHSWSSSNLTGGSYICSITEKDGGNSRCWWHTNCSCGSMYQDSHHWYRYYTKFKCTGGHYYYRSNSPASGPYTGGCVDYVTKYGGLKYCGNSSNHDG